MIGATLTYQTFKNLNKKNKLRDEEENTSLGSALLKIFVILLTLIALYLAFKCHNGFTLGSFLAACFCPVLYIAYRLAVKCKKN